MLCWRWQTDCKSDKNFIMTHLHLYHSAQWREQHHSQGRRNTEQHWTPDFVSVRKKIPTAIKPLKQTSIIQKNTVVLENSATLSGTAATEEVPVVSVRFFCLKFNLNYKTLTSKRTNQDTPSCSRLDKNTVYFVYLTIIFALTSSDCDLQHVLRCLLEITFIYNKIATANTFCQRCNAYWIKFLST